MRKCAHMCDWKCACQCVYLHPFHVCLSTCLSVSLPACVHSSVKARKKNRRQWEREEVLSVSVGWAGSWWEQEGRRLAGRSHALFRHHSVGARPLGQNTTHIFTHVNTTHTHLNTPGQRVVFCNRSFQKLLQQIQTQSCKHLAFHIHQLNIKSTYKHQFDETLSISSILKAQYAIFEVIK